MGLAQRIWHKINGRLNRRRLTLQMRNSPRSNFQALTQTGETEVCRTVMEDQTGSRERKGHFVFGGPPQALHEPEPPLNFQLNAADFEKACSERRKQGPVWRSD